MLRIGISPQPSPSDAPPPSDSPSPDQSTTPVDAGDGGSDDSSKIDPDKAGYQGPEEGPFECEHCSFWSAPSSCMVVSGPIDAHGCCNNYSSAANSDEDESMEAPEQGPDDANTPTPSSQPPITPGS